MEESLGKNEFVCFKDMIYGNKKLEARLAV